MRPMTRFRKCVRRAQDRLMVSGMGRGMAAAHMVRRTALTAALMPPIMLISEAVSMMETIRRPICG